MTTTDLVASSNFYDQARSALAAAVRVDEAIAIRDRAARMAFYAKQAKDRELLANATELRLRAERRLGELMLFAEGDGQLQRGGRPRHADVERVATLAEIGIDKKTSARAKASARLTAQAFESAVAEARTSVLQRVAAGRARTIRVARPEVTILAGVRIEALSFGQLERLRVEATALAILLTRISQHAVPHTSTVTVGEAIAPERLAVLVADAKQVANNEPEVTTHDL